MDAEIALRELKAFQEWRRGGEGEQPDPARVGEVIDFAILALRFLVEKRK